MTQKELLYMEDAVNHEKSIISILEKSIELIDDDELINFLEDEINVHEELKERLLNHMEDKSYE